MSRPSFDKQRELVRAQGYRPGIEAMRLSWIDKEEEAYWRKKAKEAERRLKQISERIAKQREQRAFTKDQERVLRQAHKSLSRYEMPEGA